MVQQELVQVALDKDLVRKLLEGLVNGAKNKALKVVITTHGHYQVESKELRMHIETEGDAMRYIRIRNDKQLAVVTREEIQAMGLAGVADSAVKELKSKYSPVFHSLADNIVVFNRAYTENGFDPG